MPSKYAITGVVLAGGLGRRMRHDGSQRDKGLRLLAGRPLVQHAIERLAPQVSTVLINANRELDAYRLFGHAVIIDQLSDVPQDLGAPAGAALAGASADAPAGVSPGVSPGVAAGVSPDVAAESSIGPLAGLQAAMRASPTPWVACVPCDAPFFPHDLIARLAAALDAAHADSGADAASERPRLAVAGTPGRRQPVFCLAERSLADSIEGFVAGGGRKVDDWLDNARALVVAFDDEAAFRNLNTPEDLRRAEALLCADTAPGGASR